MKHKSLITAVILTCATVVCTAQSSSPSTNSNASLAASEQSFAARACGKLQGKNPNVTGIVFTDGTYTCPTANTSN